MFKGSLVALITPMRPDGSLDEKAFADFVEWQIAEGTHGLVPVGTTGESPTLSHEEHKRVVEIAVEVSNGRVPVIAGAGSNSTEEAIGLAQHAKAAGANGILVVTPYYNKPTQEGMFLHFSAIADAADIPMIIYNIPPRSVVDMSVETMARLAKHRNIVGVKDATANLVRPLHTRRACGEDFCQLSGEDHTALSFNAAGGVGCIGQQRTGQRRPFRRLENAGIASGQRRPQLPGGQHQRRVPGRDDHHHASRIVPHDVVRLLGVDGAVLQRQRMLGEPADVEHGTRHHAMAHARQQHAGVVALQQAQGVGALADLLCKAVQKGFALGGAERAPGGKSLLRGADRGVDLFGAGFRDAAQQALVNRAMQLEGRPGADPLAVDVMIGGHGDTRHVDELGCHVFLSLMWVKPEHGVGRCQFHRSRAHGQATDSGELIRKAS